LTPFAVCNKSVKNLLCQHREQSCMLRYYRLTYIGTKGVKSSFVETIAAQTEGDTGYDYNDIYDEDYEEESGTQHAEIYAFELCG